MACSLLLQKKKREVSGHPITVGQTRGGHGGRLSPSCLAAPSLSGGWAEGFPGHLSTFACSPSWSRCLCGLLSALTLTHEGHHGPADNRKALPLVQPLS